MNTIRLHYNTCHNRSYSTESSNNQNISQPWALSFHLDLKYLCSHPWHTATNNKLLISTYIIQHIWKLRKIITLQLNKIPPEAVSYKTTTLNNTNLRIFHIYRMPPPTQDTCSHLHNMATDHTSPLQHYLPTLQKV